MDDRIRRAAFGAMEVLENRQLLASISGTVIDDLNTNGDRDGREQGIRGITIFLDQNQNRNFDAGETSTVTDGNGYYQFDNLPAGRYYVAQALPGDYAQSSPSRNGFGVLAGNFDLQLNFPGTTLDSRGRSLFESAAARWEKVLVGDVADVNDPEDGLIDDIVIDATGPTIDGKGGILGQAKPDKFRDSDSASPNIPYRASMQFDKLDLRTADIFDVIVHEMGHALGFTLQTWFRYDPPLVSGTIVEPVFTGENAIREYNAIFGVDSNGVPLQDYTAGQGSSFSHFSENLFRNELMTPFTERNEAGQRLSRVTVGVMEDLGYEVNYRGADPYTPNSGPLVRLTPLTAGGGSLDFSYTLDLESDADSAQGTDFMSRQNARPSIDGLKADTTLIPNGEIFNLSAVGAFDDDAGDTVTAVNFYAETNGIAGLQGGATGDLFIGSDESPLGGFRLKVRTGQLHLPASFTTFYARPYDELSTTGKAKSVSVALTDDSAPPAKPASISAVALSSSQVLVTFNDKSNNEVGFRLERSEDQFFNSGVQRFLLGPGETSFTDKKLAGGAVYFYRVRAYNGAGSSGYTGPVSVITPNRAERTIDIDLESDEAASRGLVDTVRADGALGGTTVTARKTGRILVSPNVEFKGDYFLYARWADLGETNDRGVFSVTDANGKLKRPVEVDQGDRGQDGAWVYIGKYSFNTAQSATINFAPATSTQRVNLDAIRLLPAFNPPTR